MRHSASKAMFRDNSSKRKVTVRVLLGVANLVRKYTPKKLTKQYLSMVPKVNARKQMLMHYVVRNVT